MMRRFVCLGRVGVAVVVMVAWCQVIQAQPGERQRGGRRGGGPDFGIPPIILATADEVQDALKLSDEQNDRIEAIRDQLQDDARELFRGDRREFRQLRTDLQKLQHDATAKLDEVLDAEQQKRLMGIVIQVNGNRAVADPNVAKEIKINDEQKKQLAAVRDDAIESTRKAFSEVQEQGLSRDEMRTKMDAIRVDADKKVLAVLTAEQQKQLESLKGEPVEIDRAQFWRRGDFRGFGGGRGDRQRDRDKADGGESASMDQ